ncbi:UNVERIFIED_CONTAM: Cuticle protein 16.8 [Trichonephila clavipes]
MVPDGVTAYGCAPERDWLFLDTLVASVVMFVVAVFSCVALVQASIPIEVHRPQPYKFGYSVKDHHGEQHREEVGNGAGGVVGSYGFTDARGIARQVNYVADHAGFRAQVKTNEPGTANQNPAAVQILTFLKFLTFTSRAIRSPNSSIYLKIALIEVVDLEKQIN